MDAGQLTPDYIGTAAASGDVEARPCVFITVAVPTCNRPDDVARLLVSLSEVRYSRWELLLVDQSDGDETDLLAAAWGAVIPRIVYLRLAEKNASAARNLAIESASGDVLAFIDDDCTVSPDYLDRIREAFEEEPAARLIFGAVTAVDHDPGSAFVPVNGLRRERRLRGALGELRLQGIGASMSIRLGSGKRPYFDEFLGPGARFGSSQDVDYAFRVLAAGETVVQTPRIAVVHHGARSHAEGAARTKLRDYMYGAGACHAKLLRCGHRIMLGTVIGTLARSVGGIRPQNLLQHQPTHAMAFVIYVRGLLAGLRTPIDRRDQLFT
jgi:glycosyltransferase involved in cell wall biosynthesis